MLKVESGIPLPKRPAKGPTKYPWTALEVGQSFLIPGGTLANLRSSCTQAGKRYKMKFVARQVANNVRIWRVR